MANDYKRFFTHLITEGEQCAMVDVPMLDEIKKLLNEIPNDIVYQPDNPDFGKEHNPHVTILFGIENESQDDAMKILKSISEKIEVTLGKVSKFTGANFDVLKVDVTSPKLNELNKLLRQSVKYSNDHPNYIPHLTLAYLKNGQGEEFVGRTDLEGKKMQLDTISYSTKLGNKVHFKIGQPMSEYNVGSSGGYGSAAGGPLAPSNGLATPNSPQSVSRLKKFSQSGGSYMQGNTVVWNGLYEPITDEDLADSRFSKDEIYAGIRHEMRKQEYPNKEMARKIVISNLEKNPKFYSGLGMYLKEGTPMNKELEIGSQIEHEHTNDNALAQKIAQDHISEDPRYYSKLMAAGLGNDEPAAVKMAAIDRAQAGQGGNVSLARLIPAGIAAPTVPTTLKSSGLGVGAGAPALTSSGLKTSPGHNQVANGKTPPKPVEPTLVGDKGNTVDKENGLPKLNSVPAFSKTKPITPPVEAVVAVAVTSDPLDHFLGGELHEGGSTLKKK